MKKKFTILIAAAVMLLTMMATTGEMWGQTRDNYSQTYNYSDLGSMLSGNYLDASSYWKVPETAGNTATVSIPITYQPTSNITITFNIATFGSGTNPSSSNTTITAVGTETESNWTGSTVSSYPSSSSYVNGVMTITKPANPTTLGGLTITMGVNTGVKIFRLKSITVSYTYDGSSLQPCDLALTGAPIALEFDLYNNSDAQTVTYTTSSTGEITITPASPTNYFSYVHNAGDKTITVTPSAVTPSAQTVTISQAADDDYEAGSVSFTVTIGDSTPIPTHTATFSVNGETTSEEYEEGAAIVFPDDPDDIDDKTFVGWVAEEISGTTNTAPDFVTNAVMGNSNVVFYACFAVESSGSSASLTKMTSGDTFAVDDKVVIVAVDPNDNSFAMYQETVNSTYVNKYSFDNNVATVASDDKNWFTVSAGSNGTWKLGDATNGFVYNNTSNNLAISTTNSTDFTLAWNSTNEKFTLKKEDRWLSYRHDLANNNNDYFRMGGTNATPSGTGYFDVYKYSAGSVSYSNYCTTVAAAAVATPVITVTENPFLFSTTATITCATEGAAIKYSYDDENWSDYSTPLTITETKTVYAKAIKDENESSVASVTITKNLAVPTVTIDATGITNTNVFTGTAAGSLAASVTYNDAAVEGASVTWSGDNDEVATIDASTGAVALVAAGSVTFTATYAGNADYSEKTATYEMFVTNINPNAPGTQNNPYTVAEARDAIDAEDDVDDVYVKGIVSGIVTAYSSQFHNISYNISADGLTSSDQLQAYRGKSYNGGNFTSEDDIQVGDSVVVFGDLQNYQGTYEFKANNELVYLMRKTITVEPNSTDVDADEHDGTLTLTISNMTVASTDDLAVQFYDAEGEELGSSAEPDWILFDDFEENNGIYTIDYTIGQNTTTDDRVAYLKVWTSATTQELEHVVYSNLVTIAQDAPIVIEYYQYSINGVEGDMVQTASGTSITLPTTVENVPQGFSFAGWTTDANDMSIILAPGASYTINATVEFFAVYSKTVSGTPVTAFNKVTSISEGDYLIVYETDEVAFDGGRDNIEDAIDAVENTIDIEFLSDGVIASNSTTDAAIFIIAESESKDDPTYTIQSVSGFYIGKTTSGNGMNVNASTKYTNSITFDGSGNAVITASGGSVLKYNDASNQLRFRYYGSGQKAIQLYKKTTSVPTVTTYYTRVFPADTQATADINIEGPTIIGSGSVLDMGDYKLTNDNPANLVIEDGGQLIHDNPVSATIQRNITGYGRSNPSGYQFIASPVKDDLNVDETNLTTSGSYDLYIFDQSQPSKEWRNYKANEFTTIGNGVGYLYANTTNITISFSGELKPSDNDVPVTLAYTDGNRCAGWNLIGNPFACKAYIKDATGDIEAFYRMNGNGDGYDAVVGAINPMEGIFVQANDKDQYFYFTRTAPDATPGKGNLNLEIAQVVTNRDARQATDNAIIRFDGGNTLEKFSFSEDNAKLFIPQNGKDYAVVSADTQGEMPVNFKAAENGTYTIDFSMDNVEFSYLHLIDNKTGMDIDLLQTSSYTFEASKIDYASRFKLVFSTNSNSNSNDDNDFAFFDANGNLLILGNEGTATLQVIDITGRTVSNETFSGNYSKAINAKAGVYMLRLIQGNDVRTQKIVVR